MKYLAPVILFVVLLAGCSTAPEDGSQSGYVPPRALHTVLPSLPPGTIPAGGDVHVEVGFVVDTSGRVGPLAFIVTAPNPPIDETVLAALKHWTYTPALMDGHRVRAELQLPIDFSADESGHVTAQVGTDPGFPSPERMVPDVPAKPVERVAPVWPAGYVGERPSEVVVVDFLVTTRGDVRNAYVLGHPDRQLSAAAVAAVEQWKFEPARKNGRAVTSHVQVPIVFALQNQTAHPVSH